jgi:hypothetical protein
MEIRLKREREKNQTWHCIFKGNNILEIFNEMAINPVKKVTVMKQQQILLFLTWVF